MKRSLLLTTAILVSGCAGLSAVRGPITQFGEGARSAASAENSFLRATISADCTSQFYQSGLQYSLGKAENFTISPSCQARAVTPEQLQLRKALMDTIVLYAEKLAVLASSDTNEQLSDAGSTLATNINALAKAGGLQNMGLAAGVEAAVVAITSLVLDQVRYSAIRDAASAMQEPLQQVAMALKDENLAFANTINTNLNGVEIALRLAIAQESRRGRRASLLDIVRARELVISTNPLSNADDPISPGTAASNPQALASPINATLDLVVEGNRQIANGQPTRLAAVAEDLVQRAQAAVQFYNALTKAGGK